MDMNFDKTKDLSIEYSEMANMISDIVPKILTECGIPEVI